MRGNVRYACGLPVMVQFPDCRKFSPEPKKGRRCISDMTSRTHSNAHANGKLAHSRNIDDARQITPSSQEVREGTGVLSQGNALATAERNRLCKAWLLFRCCWTPPRCARCV